ncbi:MAG: phage head morphogenesis protein [Lachnospiraceae bacterium]|nr:phage head morphogenesis protein [Lachnospiraceae bacterium]
MMIKLKKMRRCSCDELIKAIDAYVTKADDDIERALRRSGFANPKATRKQITELEEELTRILEEDTAFVVNIVNDYDDLRTIYNEAWPEIRDREHLTQRLSRRFEQTFSEIIPDYVDTYIKRTDPELSSLGLTHATTAWIQDWSYELGELMRLTDNRQLENILDEGLRDGLSVQEVSEKISDSGIRDPGYRARRAATTEILRAHNVAQQESFMQSPAVESKMWRHSGWREYSRQNHIDMDGQIVKKDEPFTLVGADGAVYYPMYPMDSMLPAGETINCGCIEQPIVSEDVLGLSLEERQRLQEEAIAELDEDFDRQLDEQNKRLRARSS